MVKEYKNGLRVTVTNMPGFDSVAFNVFVGTGSINEIPENYGISHFIEHTMFKGTKTRTAQDIARELDAVGANVNAYTDRTETVYHTKSTSDNLEKCVEILSDMLLNSTFNEKELKREKKVVCEEISMYYDNPSTASNLMSDTKLYEGSDYEMDVAGTKKIVKSLTRQQILDYIKKFYIPSNIIISFAGNITEKVALNLVEKYFKTMIEKEYVESTNKKHIVPQLKQSFELKKFKENEQSHITIGYRALPNDNENYVAQKVLNTILGTGMSSRLFSVIREKLGLVYTIYSGIYSSNDCADISIILATLSKNVPLALQSISKVLKDFAENGAKEKEFLDAKSQLIANTKLTFENTYSVAMNASKSLFNYGKIIDKNQWIEMAKNVTIEQVNNLAKTLFLNKNHTIAMVGKNTRLNLENCYKF